MRRPSALVALAFGFMASPLAAAEQPPAWAYPVNPPDFRAEVDTGEPRHVPDSDLTVTLTQIRDLFYSPDWHPADHQPQPSIVANGRKPDVQACGSCHRADGRGGPENANLTGLTAGYIAREVEAFRNGTRTTSEPKRVLLLAKMVQLSKSITEDELAQASGYFAAQPYRSMIDVVEADLVPKTYSADWHLSLVPDGGTEPIGDRIIEVPIDNGYFTSRNSHVRFTAYVPPGSVARGKLLATTGGDGRTVACSICHGADLKGTAVAPAIIARSPSYVVRQLLDIQAGSRSGGSASLMKPTVEHLTLTDMIELAAYTSSLTP